MTVTRPPSPALSVDYSIISPPSPSPDRNSILPSHSGRPQLYLSPPSWPGSSSSFSSSSTAREKRHYNTIHGSPSAQRAFYRTPQGAKSMKHLIPKLWGALSSPARKGRRKASRRKSYTMSSNPSYLDLLPLDGEEGELIDEACFVEQDYPTALPPTATDIISRLPPEIAIHLLCFLDLQSVLACRGVSRQWYTLASDAEVWRGLFFRRPGWGINLERAFARGFVSPAPASLPGSPDSPAALPSAGMSSYPSPLTSTRPARSQSTPLPRDFPADAFDFLSPIPARAHALTPSPWSPEQPADVLPPLHGVPLSLPWRELYASRAALDARWAGAAPRETYLSGHTDSVYCLEFDSARILTGSRDQTIKAWDIRTGRCLGTFRGHYGSVLCLKFEKDWDIGGDGRRGFMVSGSSDRRACVWDVWVGEHGEVCAEVRAVLRGHQGGVLDLRVDEQWIVSCSKDTKIRVWDRATLELRRVLVGHEGPVNAIGLQNGLVVSASGDTKMMLWDIERGVCLRTFDGHDRGLACIEFKDNYIVSGSSDCKIKVWDAQTGACVRTLVGHDALVRALALDPASGRLVSASYDKAVKVWDLRTGRLVQQFRHHHLGHIFDVKFDVHRIVSTSHDQRIVVLDFAQGLDAALFT
ncbi:WD40-repeat-containing domain protein [Gloeopeniophorella convolvens]|nr:WD40-repeat-containing domain protein [Gloeopeniophorella convolvens]